MPLLIRRHQVIAVRRRRQNINSLVGLRCPRPDLLSVQLHRTATRKMPITKLSRQERHDFFFSFFLFFKSLSLVNELLSQSGRTSICESCGEKTFSESCRGLRTSVGSSKVRGRQPQMEDELLDFLAAKTSWSEWSDLPQFVLVVIHFSE